MCVCVYGISDWLFQCHVNMLSKIKHPKYGKVRNLSFICFDLTLLFVFYEIHTKKSWFGSLCLSLHQLYLSDNDLDDILK